MNKMSNYNIEKNHLGEESLIIKNQNGRQIASGILPSAKNFTRRKLRNISRDAVEADIEIQLKDGYDVKSGTKFEVFKAEDDKISFRLREDSGNVLLSGDTYSSLSECIAAIDEVRESLRDLSNSSDLTAIHKMPAFKAQKAAPKFATVAEELKQAELRSENIGFSVTMNTRKRPSFISGRISEEKITSAKKAICSLNLLHHTMGFENAEQEFCEDDIEIRRQNDGTTFYRMRQYHKGIPVFANSLIISTDAEGNTETLSGHYTHISCNDYVKITEDQAIVIVEKSYGKVENSEGLIYYTDDDTEKAFLCWCLNTMEHQFFISTVDGTIVKQYSNIIDIDINTNKRASTTMNATVDISILNKDGHAPYSLYDGARNIEIFDDHDDKNKPETLIEASSLEAKEQSKLTEAHAVTAYDNINRVYDYYRNVLGRKGADDNGKKIHILMNDSYFKGKANAGFYPSYSNYTRIGISAIGDYDRCLDVLGHEFTHAVNDAIWTPVREKQSNALNEAYADIMGEYIQDDTLDYMADLKPTGAIRKFDNNMTFDQYADNKDCHVNCQIMTHAAYLIHEKWPLANRRCELSMLYYRSMEYLQPQSTFVDCYYALLMSALKNCMINDISKKIGAIADAFLETRVFPNISEYKNSSAAVTVTGKVKNKKGIGVAGVTVSAYLESNDTECKCSTITDSDGKYEMKLDKNQKYVIKFSRYDGYKGEIKTGSVTVSNNGPFEFTSNSNLWFNIASIITKRTFMISGRVKHPDTGKPVSDAIVRIVKGHNYESQAMAMKPELTLKTDSNGYFFTAALPYGEYDVWVYCPIKNSENCLTKVVNINNFTEQTLDITLSKKKRFYVTGFCVHSASSTNDAKAKTKSNYALIDVDLNADGPGDRIYLSYGLGNTGNPITNLLIYESDKAETWDTKEFTSRNVKALYHRLGVNLNRNAGGKYLYLCYTYDKHYDPLTKLDVIVDNNKNVREPHWSGVRVVRENGYSVNSYADANAGLSQGSIVHIMQTRKEIM